jgi:hypothetical protein
MTKVIVPPYRSHFSSVLYWIILHSNISFHLKEKEVTMSPIFDTENGIKNLNLPEGENSERYTSDSEKNLNNLSREAAELLMRLNELANGYPFNIIYRARINDPR